MTDTIEHLSERDEIELLLPWYATGKLDPADKARVEHHLARDVDLRRQLELIREEEIETIAASEAIRLPVEFSVDKTLGAVARSSPLTGALNSLGASLKALFNGSLGQPLRWTAAAAGLALVVQTAVIGHVLTSRPDATYTTASGGKTDAALAGTFALIRFTETTTAKDIVSTLAELGMTIVDGPRSGGLYRVRIAAGDLSEAARAERLAQIRSKSAIINFVTLTP